MSDLKSKLPINIEELHLCCQAQPQLAHDAGDAAAEAKAAAKRAKAALEEAKANADREIRQSPEKFGLAKITESAVSSAVVLHPAVKSATEDSIETDLLSDKAAAVANAFEHRRSMLKIEAELYVNNFWGAQGTQVKEMMKSSEKMAMTSEEGVQRGSPERRRRGTE